MFLTSFTGGKEFFYKEYVVKIGLCTEDFQLNYGYEEIFTRLREIGYEGSDFTLGRGSRPNEIFSQPREVWKKEYARAKKPRADHGGILSRSAA